MKTDSAEVQVDGATQKALKDQTVKKISEATRAKITFGKKLEQGVGVIVEASSGRLRYDNTLETRLGRMQNALRSSVYKVLMGEKL